MLSPAGIWRLYALFPLISLLPDCLVLYGSYMPFPLIHYLELLGTFTFAVSGATAAVNKAYDLIGLLTLAFVTAIGGGTIRDILIGNTPVAWMTDDSNILAILAGAAVTALGYSYVKRLTRWLNVFDAIGLGIFTIIGINKGLQAGLPVPICAALGAITGTFGGLLRDVIIGEPPALFTREVYAVASITGGILFLALRHSAWSPAIIESASITVIVIVRLLSLRYGWHLPRITK